jgi:hypothetical protein
LPKHEQAPAQSSALARFFASASARTERVQVSLQDEVATFFKLADYMHVPASQGHSSGGWLVEYKSGKSDIRQHLSFMDCEKFWPLARERKLARRDTAELCWRLEDFQRNAKRNEVTYLGKPKQEGQLHMSIPDLEDWLTTYAARLDAILTHAWEETFIPSHDPLQTLVWWKSEQAFPFQARFSEVGECIPSHSDQSKFGVDAFRDFAQLLKMKYLGPLIPHMQVMDGQQAKRSTWQPEEAVIPQQPSSWPPWERPAYWCFTEKTKGWGDENAPHFQKHLRAFATWHCCFSC